MGRSGLRAAVLTIVLAAQVGACGSSTSPSTSRSVSEALAPGHMMVNPRRAAPDGQITFGFVAPRSAGVHGSVELSYVVSVMGPQRAGCVGSHSAATAEALPGRMTRATLGPTQLGGRWCPGAYTVRAEEVQRAACRRGWPCPMYVRLVGTVASGAFRIAPALGP